MSLTFIKLDINFFQNPKIQRIIRQPGGDTYIKIYVALLTMAMKSSTPGLIMISDTLPADVADIAGYCGAKESEVRAALAAFKSLSMVELHDGAVLIPSFGEHQRLDKVLLSNEKAKERMRKYREKQRLLLGVTANDTVTNGKVTPQTLDLDGDIDLKTKEKSTEREDAPADAENDLPHKSNPEKKPPLPAATSKLWEWLYQFRKANGTLPVVSKSDFFGLVCKSGCAEIEKADGFDVACEVFTWASRDKFWASQPPHPRIYDRLKTAYLATKVESEGDRKAREARVRNEKAWYAQLDAANKRDGIVK